MRTQPARSLVAGRWPGGPRAWVSVPLPGAAAGGGGRAERSPEAHSFLLALFPKTRQWKTCPWAGIHAYRSPRHPISVVCRQPAPPARPCRPPAVPLLAQADGLQLAAVLVLDPLHALQLRIHDEGPALCVAQNRGILSGHAVAGEALVVPRGHVCVIRQQAQGVQTFRDGDGDLPGGSAWAQAGWLM